MSDYSENGYDVFLERIDPSKPQRYDPVAFGYQYSDLDGDKISTMLSGNLVGKGISADSITTGEMSFDRAQGGSLTLGGLNNKLGQFFLKDEEANDRVTMDKDGIIIKQGALNIKDNKNNTVIDASGIVSTTAFNWYNITDETDRTATSATMDDITNTSLNIILERPTTIIFFISMQFIINIGTNRLYITVGLNIDGTLYPTTSGFGTPVGWDCRFQAAGISEYTNFSSHYLTTLNTGAHYAKLQWQNYLSSPAGNTRETLYTSLTALLLGK